MFLFDGVSPIQPYFFQEGDKSLAQFLNRFSFPLIYLIDVDFNHFLLAFREAASDKILYLIINININL